MKKTVWYYDFMRAADKNNLSPYNVIKELLFHHGVRYVVYFRIAQNTKSRLIKLFFEIKLFRMCRKYGIEIKTNTRIGKSLLLMHPYNITVSPRAVLGNNVNLLKGSTIGYSCGGKRVGAPIIGDNVFVGINSTVVGNIKVGNDVLIAPNTLVNIDVPDHSIVFGNPCKFVHRENATSQYIYNCYDKNLEKNNDC